MSGATAERRVLSSDRIAQRQRAALRKALEQRTWERVEGYRTGEWGVQGSTGATYWVYLRGGELSCSCPSGARHVACYHQASVLLTLLPASWRYALAGS